MPNRVFQDGEFIKFEVERGVKARFIAACRKLQSSQSAILREIVEEFVNEVEGIKYPELPAP